MKTDSLLNSDNVFIDVDEIINKYNNSNDTKTLVGEEIWSEPIDVFSSNKHHESDKKNSTDILEKQNSEPSYIANAQSSAANFSNTRAIPLNDNNNLNTISLNDFKITSKLNSNHSSIKTASINNKTASINNTNKLDIDNLQNIFLKNTKLMSIKEKNTEETTQNILDDNPKNEHLLDKDIDVRLSDIQEKLDNSKKSDNFDKSAITSPMNVQQIELNFLANETKPLKTIDTKILTKTRSLNEDNSQLDKMYSNFETSELNNSIVFSSKENSDNNQKETIVKSNNVSKILFNDTNIINNELTKQINDAENISFNHQILEKKIGFWTSRSISKEKKQKSKLQTKGLTKTLPRFYRLEYLYAKLFLALFIIFSIISIATLSYVLIQIFSFHQSTLLLLPQTFFNLFSFCLLLFAINRLLYIRKEAKINNYTIETEKSTPYIKKIYRSLSTSSILLNWLAASVYIVVIAGIIITFVVTYFYNLINNQINNFGLLSLDGGNNIAPLICVWTFASCGIFFIIWQVLANVLNRKRKNEIELFYQKELISDELIQKYRKAATIKGMIIFFTITIAITVFGLVIWLVLKRRALKK